MGDAVCKSCGQPIVWVTMLETGKAMPIDKATIEKRVVLDGPWSRGAMRDTGLSHFATCPQAAQHRKPKGPRPADPACPHCHGEGYPTEDEWTRIVRPATLKDAARYGFRAEV